MKSSLRTSSAFIQQASTAESINQDLRIHLWMILSDHFFTKFDNGWSLTETAQMVRYIQTAFFAGAGNAQAVAGDADPGDFLSRLESWFFEAEGCKVLDFLDFILPVIRKEGDSPDEVIHYCNYAMETEDAGYRIMDNKVIRVLTCRELQEIQQAVQGIAQEPVSKHFSRALELLGDRKMTNYREAVLEAIAAVDYVVELFPPQRINGETLLPIISNPNGLVSVKHALTEGSMAVSFDKARYWLVACASSINLLKEKVG